VTMSQRLIPPSRVEEEQRIARNGILRTIQTFEEANGETNYTVTRYVQNPRRAKPNLSDTLRLTKIAEKMLRQQLESFMELKKKAAETTSNQ